jgi:hypothetical protein
LFTSSDWKVDADASPAVPSGGKLIRTCESQCVGDDGLFVIKTSIRSGTDPVPAPSTSRLAVCDTVGVFRTSAREIREKSRSLDVAGIPDVSVHVDD